MKFIRIVLVSIVFLLSACKSKEIIKEDVNTPKKIILLIGDGTGLSQISTAFYFKENTPNYERFNHIGLIKTSSSEEYITDSAAAGTAFACGVKTYNGAIGVASDSTEVKNIVEIISSQQIKSGLISTSSITHATPASFYAHTLRRGYEEEIASDFVQSDVDFIAGGGIRFFNQREDGKNLLDDLVQKNFYVDTIAIKDFSSIESYSKVAYLLANNHMPPAAEGRGDFLANATELAIQFLGKDNANFFMMVEGSQVDWGGHANNGDYLVSELIDFDDAIGKALDYAEQDGNTLVIVTADHETGGLTLAPTLKKTEDGEEYSDYDDIDMVFSTKGHSATLVPIFAYGPGAEEFAGIYENTDIFERILNVTKWGENQ